MRARLLCVGFAALAATSVASAGPDWVEFGDAGPLLESAQEVLGEGNVFSIQGSLTGAAAGAAPTPAAPDFEDMYLIRITQPSMFSFQSANANFNAQCFLFNITLPGEAFGLLANDDTLTSNQPLLVSPATDGTGAAVVLPGVYALAISGSGRNPVSNSGLIFNFASSTEVSGPDGPGGINPHNGWAGTGATGTYELEITGVEFYDIPAPGAAALFAVAAGTLTRRRRPRA